VHNTGEAATLTRRASLAAVGTLFHPDCTVGVGFAHTTLTELVPPALAPGDSRAYRHVMPAGSPPVGNWDSLPHPAPKV